MTLLLLLLLLRSLGAGNATEKSPACPTDVRGDGGDLDYGPFEDRCEGFYIEPHSGGEDSQPCPADPDGHIPRVAFEVVGVTAGALSESEGVNELIWGPLPPQARELELRADWRGSRDRFYRMDVTLAAVDRYRWRADRLEAARSRIASPQDGRPMPLDRFIVSAWTWRETQPPEGRRERILLPVSTPASKPSSTLRFMLQATRTGQRPVRPEGTIHYVPMASDGKCPGDWIPAPPSEWTERGVIVQDGGIILNLPRPEGPGAWCFAIRTLEIRGSHASCTTGFLWLGEGSTGQTTGSP